MPATVILTVTEEGLKERQFVFHESARCLVGRAECCNVRLPTDEEHWSVSRLHCLLDIRPPHVFVRDLGSRNGTYVNGWKIGQRAQGQSPKEGLTAPGSEYYVIDGDEIRVGNTAIAVAVVGSEGEGGETAPALDGDLLSVG